MSNTRLRAILNAVYFGVLPYWVYENVKHYRCSYFEHLLINIQYALRWATFKEDESDREFEFQINKKGK